MNYYINVGQLQVLPEGALDRGYYHYTVRAILENSTLDLANTLKVYASYPKNSVGLFWDPVPGAIAYQLFRRTGDQVQSAMVYGPAYFFDTGHVEFEDYGGED